MIFFFEGLLFAFAKNAQPFEYIFFNPVLYLIPAFILVFFFVKVHRNAGRNLLLLISSIALTFYFADAIYYLFFYQNYSDHFEPLISSVSCIYNKGEALYTLGDALYSVAYGPLLFMINGFFLKLNASMFCAKLPGILAAYLSIFILFFLVRKKSDNTTSFISVGFLALIFLLHDTISFWNRPEPFLLLLVVLGLASLEIRNPLLCLMMVSVCIGFSINLKVYAFIYFIPFLAYRKDLLNAQFLFMGSVISLLVFLLPFSKSNISLSQYLFLLKSLAGSTRFNLSQLVQIAQWAVLYLLLLRGNKNRKVFILILVSTLTLLLLAAQAGEKYYLLPLLPVILYARSLSTTGFSAQGLSTIAVCSLGLLLFTIFLSRSYLQINRHWHHLVYEESMTEFKGILGKYKERVAVGYTDVQHYVYTFNRDQCIFAGNPLYFDAGALMVYETARTPYSEKLNEALDTKIDYLVLPRGGKPFSLLSFYPPHHFVFPETFRKKFQESFTVVDSTNIYLVYKRK